MYLILVILFTAALRLLNLGQLPSGLYLDEVLYGLDAYSIIKTGKDIYGHFLPLTFQSSGYYPPLFTYILAPLFLIFPLSSWVVRLPSALAGIATIIMIYFLTQKLIGNKPFSSAPILASLLLAFLPWHIHLSRVAFLGSFGLIFLVLGAYFFLKQKILLSLVIFMLSTHIHYGYKFLSPALFLILLFLYRARLNILGYLIILITLISHLFSIRYYNALFRVSELSGQSLTQVAGQYLTAFSPQFLFLRGDHYSLLNPWGRGQLPLIFIPLLIAGLYSLKDLSQSSRRLLIFWTLITPIPSALAGLGAHAIRNSPIIIPLIIIAALGCSLIISHSKFFGLIIISLFMVHFLSFLRFYTQIYPSSSAHLWGQPERQLVNQLIHTPGQQIIPDKFYVTLANYAFYTRLDPRLLQQALATRTLGNLYFADQ